MRSIVGVVAAVSINLASSAAAQGETERPIKETRQDTYSFGACTVKHHARVASEAVLRNVDRLTLQKHYSAVTDAQCLRPGATLMFPGDFYLYAMADALTARELTTVPAPDLSGVPPLEPRPVRTFADLKREFGYDRALSLVSDADILKALSAYGECVVRQSPENAKALLMVEPESDAEPGRFEALQPAFSACLPDGKTIQMGKSLIRGTIAVNYYRLAQKALHTPIH